MTQQIGLKSSSYFENSIAHVQCAKIDAPGQMSDVLRFEGVVPHPVLGLFRFRPMCPVTDPILFRKC